MLRVLVKYFIYGAVVVGATLCCAICPTYAAKLPRYGVFFYSTQCYEQNSGDAGGGNLKLTRTPQGDKLEFGSALEGPMEELVATNVRIDSGGAISFIIPPDPDSSAEDKANKIFTAVPHKYSGTISTDQVRLMMSGVGKYGVMPRRDLNDQTGTCR